MNKVKTESSIKMLSKRLPSEDIYLDENLADESLSDCLEFLIRTTPTTTPEWMN